LEAYAWRSTHLSTLLRCSQRIVCCSRARPARLVPGYWLARRASQCWGLALTWRLHGERR